MRTTINIPINLLREAQQITGLRTKTMVVTMGLQELIHKGKLRDLQKLRGKMPLNLDLNYSRKGKR